MVFQYKKNKGFTLVELIVVIVILGILAVIAAPKFMSMKLEAKNAALQGLAASIKSAANEFHAKAVIAGADYDIPNGSYGGDHTLFDYVTGFSYNLYQNPDYSQYTVAKAKCEASPSCSVTAMGYPKALGYNPDFYINGNGQAPFGVNRFINSDSKFVLAVAGSLDAELFFMEEDLAFVKSSNYYVGMAPLAIPCSVLYVYPMKSPFTLYKAEYNGTQWIPTEAVINPGDMFPHVYVQPCIK